MCEVLIYWCVRAPIVNYEVKHYERHNWEAAYCLGVKYLSIDVRAPIVNIAGIYLSIYGFIFWFKFKFKLLNNGCI